MAKVLFIVRIVDLGLAIGVFLVSRDTTNPYQNLASNNAPSNSITQPAQPTQVAQTAQPTVAQQTPFPTTSWISAKSAVITTTKGPIAIQLYPQDAPKTVTNFATLAKLGYYNGLTFHRVVPGFVIQGGDPNGNGTGGYSIYGPTFGDELNASASSYKAGYLEGVVAMANSGPNTNGSQFFIMLADNPSLPKAYTIFGKVTQGMDVVKKIVVGDKMAKVTVE